MVFISVYYSHTFLFILLLDISIFPDILSFHVFKFYKNGTTLPKIFFLKIMFLKIVHNNTHSCASLIFSDVHWLIIWIYLNLFTHSLVDRNLDCFPFLLLQCCNERSYKCLLKHKCGNLGYIPMSSYVIHIPVSEILGRRAYASLCIFTFKYCLLGLWSACTNSHLLQQGRRVPISPYDHQHLKLSDFNFPIWWIWNGTSLRFCLHFSD